MHSLKKASQFWNIPFISLSNHLNGKIRFRKMVYIGVLMDEKYVVIVAWILVLQKCKLSPTLQQLKMKVLELTQNMTNTIQAQNTRELLVLLVQMHA